MAQPLHRAVIVGATSGIGLEVARILHAQGCRLALAGRRTERLKAIRQELGSDIVTAELDVCRDDAPEKLQAMIRQLGGADLVLLASGIGWQNADLAPDVELRTAETNVVGFTRMVDAAFNHFAATGGGHIAVISSIAGTKGLGAAPAYSATKRYQNTYIQCLTQLARVRKLNIRFTDIRPGFTDTALLSGQSYPLLMRPERVARSIVRAIRHGKRTIVIDWRYRLLTACWRCIPDGLWERLNIGIRKKPSQTNNPS